MRASTTNSTLISPNESELPSRLNILELRERIRVYIVDAEFPAPGSWLSRRSDEISFENIGLEAWKSYTAVELSSTTLKCTGGLIHV